MNCDEESNVIQIPKRHIQAECTTKDCNGTCYDCTLAVCSVCGLYEGALTTHCPGFRVDEEYTDMIYYEDWNYFNNQWVEPLFDSKNARYPKFKKV